MYRYTSKNKAKAFKILLKIMNFVVAKYAMMKKLEP